MKHKRLKNMLVATTAMALLTTSIPMNLPINSLTASANGGIGGGTEYGFGSISWVNDDPIDAFEIGLRFSLVTLKDDQRQLVQNSNGTYYLDIWPQGYNGEISYSYVPNYNKCSFNTESRYNIPAEKGTITSVGAYAFDNAINSYISSQGGTSNINFNYILNPALPTSTFEAGQYTFNILGLNFYNWFMDKKTTINGTDVTAYEALLEYVYGADCIRELDLDNTFLVVEPILYLRNADGINSNGTYATTGALSVSSWYGYIKHNIANEHDPGNAVSIRDRMSRIGNGFAFYETEYAGEVLGKLEPVLGVGMPAVKLPETGGACFNFADKNYNVYGYGIQAYWLKDSGINIDNPKDPIDTYNIDQDPKEPYKPEEPKTTTNPDNPDNPDTPDFDNTGEKTIIKTYVDLYKDADNNTYYTKATDQGTYIEKNTSSRVVITDESEQNGGYEVVAWYTSSTDTQDYTTDELHGTDMLQRTNKADSIHQSIGQELFTVDGYTSIPNISSTGSQSYTYINPTAPNSLSSTDNARQYTKTTDTLEPIQKNEENQYNKDEYIDLGTDNTIVLLYVREHGWINTNTFSGGGTNHGTGGGNNTGTGTGNDTPDNDNPEQGELKIVKAYGIVNPATHEITNDKNTETIDEVTRNVHITSEPGYRLAEYVYSTRGNATTQWNEVTAESWGQLDTTNQSKTDTSFYLKGFVDGFSEPYGSSLYSSKYAWTDTETTIDSLSPDTSSIITDLTYPGTYGTGRLSGNQLTNYNSTIYFDMPEPDNIEPKNTDTTDDVLYILFLKEDEVEYTADNFIIPESFITRHNDFATNNITVTGNLTGETTSYLFAKHKFKYSLPLVTGLSEEEGNSITAWTDPYIIASISQTNTATTSGLISKWSKTELITYNPTDDTIDKRTSTDNNYELAVKKEQTTAGILSFTNANYSYTAYRKDDKPTLAQWKLEQLGSLSADSTYSMDTSIVNLNTWIQGTEGFKGIDDWNTEICSYSNELAGNRQPNDTTNNFSLPMQFTDTKATGNGVEITIN